jgi:hypothetical protein
MTDVAGSAATAEAAAALTAAVVTGGTPAAATGDKGPGTGSPAAIAPADPFAGLDTGTLEWIGKKGVKDVASLAKTAFNAESLLGKSVQVPDANAPAEDWNKFYGRLGRPEKADGYEFKLPDGVPTNMPYDAEFAKDYKSWAFEQGLSPKQAASVHDHFVGRAAQAFKAQQEAFETKVTSATDALEKAWGAKDGEKFKAGVESATRALKGLAGGKLEASFKAAGLLAELDGKPIVVDPALALAFSEIGDKLFREGEFAHGDGGGLTDNPFVDGPATMESPGHPAKGNLTAQMAAIKKDKAGAMRMMRAADHKPSDWGLPDTE